MFGSASLPLPNGSLLSLRRHAGGILMMVACFAVACNAEARRLPQALTDEVLVYQQHFGWHILCMHDDF